MAQESFSELRAAPRVQAAARIGVGLIQGVILFILIRTDKDGAWAPQWRWLLTALAMATIVKPLVFIGGVGSLRRNTLLIWTGVAGLLAFALGAYDVYRGDRPDTAHGPGEMLMLATGVLIFIAHHLVAGADADRRVVARYPTYFDLASKHAVQIALAGLFVGVFWAVMFLGAGLFKLIGIDGLFKLIRHEGFALPATTTMFAVGVQLTDVRVALIRGVRAIGLLLLGWLTPLLALLAAAFLLALPFTGLKPLWDTRSAASILLAAAALLMVLINAAYQDGKPEHPPSIVLRWAVRLAAVLIAPLVAIAGYAVMLRIGQYGLTPERVLASACVAVGSICAVGYLIAAARPGPWMKTLEPTNIVAAVAAIVTLLALFTPLADPARLAADDQLRRIERKALSVEAIDYDFLRYRAGRYGLEALRALKAKGGDVGKRAEDYLTATQRPTAGPQALTPAQRAARITVYPKGASLPADFLAQDWSAGVEASQCLLDGGDCDAFQLDLNDDGAAEILLGEGWQVSLYAKGADGRWARVGTMIQRGCPGDLIAALKAGAPKTAPHRWRDVVAGDARFEVGETFLACPAQPPPGAPPQVKGAGKTADIRQ